VNTIRYKVIIFICILVLSTFKSTVEAKPLSSDTASGYLAYLLINEAAFPGERGWVSEADTKGCMLAVLWVLESRANHVPSGYAQKQVASVSSTDVIDIITAGGEKGQCDGFYRNSEGRCVSVPRVERRIRYLEKIAGDGTPGKFARLLDYARGLAEAYVNGGIEEVDRFSGIKRIGSVDVTGRAFGWMSNQDYYNPGGTFVKIPDSKSGALSGNRFFTLKAK